MRRAVWAIAGVAALLACAVLGARAAAGCTEFNIDCECTKVCDHGLRFGDDCRFELVYEWTCAPGSVVVTPWLANALATQRNLSAELPVNLATVPATHNGIISRAEGYGIGETLMTDMLKVVDPKYYVRIANQQLSTLDLMRIGLRFFEVDLHYFGDALRIGHCGGVHLKQFNDFIQWLSKELHIKIDYDSELLGCFSDKSKLLTDIFAVMAKFLNAPGNENEFFIIMFDDQDDLKTWDIVPKLVADISGAFGSTVFTTTDKHTLFPDRWPTRRELLALGKHIVFANGEDYGASMQPWIFYKYGPDWANWAEYDVDTLVPYPACVFRDSGKDWPTNTGAITRALSDTLMYGPFWNGTEGGHLTPENIGEFVECSVNWPSMDQARPDLLAGMVWTWAANEPTAPGRCATMRQGSSRWVSAPCTQSTFVACRNTTDNTEWIVTSKAVPFAAAASQCPTGTTFEPPLGGLSNRKLYDVLTKVGAAVPSVFIAYQS